MSVEFKLHKPTIITFTGKAQHGKNQSAEILQQLLEKQNNRVLLIANADYLKYLAKQYFKWNGEKDEIGRSILQRLGTEKIRTKFPNFWVDNIINVIRAFGDDFDFVLVTDARFENEIVRFKEEEYKVISVHVERLNFDNGLTAEQKKHSTEISLDNYNFDIYIKSANLTELTSEVYKKIFLPLS